MKLYLAEHKDAVSVPEGMQLSVRTAPLHQHQNVIVLGRVSCIDIRLTLTEESLPSFTMLRGSPLLQPGDIVIVLDGDKRVFYTLAPT